VDGGIQQNCSQACNLAILSSFGLAMKPIKINAHTLTPKSPAPSAEKIRLYNRVLVSPATAEPSA
jgi:hypothetical protein